MNIMNTRTMLPAVEIVLLWTLLTTPGASPQMPARPGKLHIASTPPGQKIIINGATRSETTDVTLVVSPGKYTVQVGTCQPQDVPVSSGETKEIHCP